MMDIKPTLAQLVERRTVVVADKSLGRWFESGRSDFFPYFFFFSLSPSLKKKNKKINALCHLIFAFYFTFYHYVVDFSHENMLFLA